MIIETHNMEETFALGETMGGKACKGEIYCINGDLGVGKTVFTKGFAKGLKIEDNVNSPTFIVLQEYHNGTMPLYHFDVYRISDSSEMEEIGYEDYFFGEGVCLIEWSEIIKDILPDNVVKILIEKDIQIGLDYRKITIIK